MKRKHVVAAILAGLVGLSPVTQAARTNLVENTLIAGPEGWQAVDLPDSARLFDPAPATPLVWTNQPPDLGGRLELSDASSGTIFFKAPSAVVQALGTIYGSFLEFELATSHQTWKDSDFVVIRGSLNGEFRAAVGVLPQLPTNDWTSYDLRLVAGNFRWNQKNGPAIAPQEFRTFLRTATELWLPAEFGTGLVETTRLRNVRIFAEEFLATQCVPAVTLDGFPGQTFRIEYQNVLGGPVWTPLTNVTLTTGNFVYIDAAAIDGLRRFYRAVELP